MGIWVLGEVRGRRDLQLQTIRGYFRTAMRVHVLTVSVQHQGHAVLSVRLRALIERASVKHLSSIEPSDTNNVTNSVDVTM